MSHTRNSSAPADAADVEHELQARRPFDGVMIALSAALLILFGIVIGRFFVTSQAVEVVDHFDGELSTLRAQLAELNRQLIQTQARETALEESSQRYRELATAQQIRADRLAARQQTINTLISGVAAQREACLSEVQQYVALNQPVPAIDVLRFAEAVFDAQSAALRQGDTTATTPGATTDIPQLPGFLQLSPPSPAPAQVSQSRATLAAPTASQYVGTPIRQQGGVFFAPPHRQRQPESNLYFTPQRATGTLSLPGNSGINFEDTASSETGDVRR